MAFNPADGAHRPGRSRLGVGLPALIAGLLLGACSARTLDDFSPEIPRDAAGAAESVVIVLEDFRLDPPAEFILTNPAGTERLRRSQGGRLPLAQKELAVPRMGQLLAYLRHYGFDDYARPAGDPPAALPTGSRRVLSVWIGSRPMRRMIDVRGMGTAGRAAEVQAVSEMSRAIQEASNSTLSLKVDPGRRTAEELLRQPGLQRGGGTR